MTEQGCLTISRPRGITRASHDRTVKVNGIVIEPRGDTRIEIDRDAQTAAVRWTGPGADHRRTAEVRHDESAGVGRAVARQRRGREPDAV